MTQWIRIEKQLGNALEDLFEEVMVLFNDQQYCEVDNAWDTLKMECRERYEIGRMQHANSDSTWDKWSDDDYAKNIREELLDYLIYAAARHTLPIRNPK